MTKTAAQTNPRLAAYNIVFSMDPDTYFTSESISRELDRYGVSISSRMVEKDLRRWADDGKLSCFSGIYARV